ncbi:hypothetical protein niasHS_003835 [Heterodera schachtii]|uniref:Uncharacterized protein n=1 Tax=Heterodera schachtii TaxID=97005 RepID=A0ABD2K3C3_HETSC
MLSSSCSSSAASLLPSVSLFLLIWLPIFAFVSSADSVKPPPECARMAFAFDQLHSSPAVGEENVAKQYKSAISIAMKCMDSYLKTQKELFSEWLKQVTELEKQLQQIAKEEQKRGKKDDEELMNHFVSFLCSPGPLVQKATANIIIIIIVLVFSHSPDEQQNECP